MSAPGNYHMCGQGFGRRLGFPAEDQIMFMLLFQRKRAHGLRLRGLVSGLALAACIGLVSPTAALAQGHGGGSHGGGVHGGGFHGGGEFHGRGGFHGGRGWGFYGVFYPGFGFYNPYWYGGFNPYYFGYAYPYPYSYDYGAPPAGYPPSAPQQPHAPGY
jgi:hypothetical protein